MTAFGPHFCILPWIHFQLEPDGSVQPCCRMKSELTMGSFKEKPLIDILNGSVASNLREAMFKGERVSACEGCYMVEESGAWSSRNDANQRFPDSIEKLFAGELPWKLSLSDVQSVDLRFTNICNFRCRSCGVRSSSAWVGDAEAMSGLDLSEYRRMNAYPSDEVLWDTLRALIPSVRHYLFAGGEPLMEDDHYKLLEELVKQGKTNVLINYSTNLSRLKHKKWEPLEMWKDFSTIQMGLSLDGVGEQGEVIRSGLNWKETQKNFHLMREKAPHVNYHIAPTMSIMNAFHITEALAFWLDEGWIRRPGELRLNILEKPSYLRVGILDEEYRVALEAHYGKWLAERKPTMEESMWNHLVTELRTVLDNMGELPSNEELRAFRHAMFTMDHLRGEKFWKHFPELAHLLF